MKMSPVRQIRPQQAHNRLPPSHSQPPQDDDAVEYLDEEDKRQERMRLDTHYLADRRQSGELHGIYYTAAPEVVSPGQQQDPVVTTQQMGCSSAPASRQSSFTHQRSPMHSPRLDRCPEDAAVLTPAAAQAPISDVEQQDQDNSRDNKVQELLAPISEATTGHKPLTLGFHRVSVWAPVNPKKPSWYKRAWKNCISRGKAVTNPKRQILFDISGQVRPGEVLALMGPSGSGKTSLLTLLGGRSAMKYKGQVTVNGAPYTKATRRRIGFVLQDDVLYESLTVRETLTYAALLRLPGAMKREDKLHRVDTVVDALGLRKSIDTIIGGFFRRGISGGERKRVSIGHELLINPAIILLDEPTSGLDSTTAMHLITLLQDLAVGGRAIATTIHQPSSRLYQKLDWLMLLAEGHMMYYGKADQVLDWFGQFGYKIPFGVSIADYILDISLGEAGYSSSGKTGTAAITELYTAFEQQHAVQEGKQLGNYYEGFSSSSNLAGQVKQLPVSSSSSDAAGKRIVTFDGVKAGDDNSSGTTGKRYVAVAVPAARDNSSNSTGHQSFSEDEVHSGSCDMVINTGASNLVKSNGSQQQLHSSSSDSSSKSRKLERAYYWDQLRVLTQRAGRVRRFEQMTGQHFFQLFAVAFITGLVWWQRGQQYYGGVQAASDVLGLLFFILLFPSMRALFRALFSFPNDYRMLMKERPSGMYNLSAYYISKMAADIPSEMINTLLFTVIAYWFGGLRHSAGAFFGLLFSLVLVTAVAESWGLLIGGVFMEPKTAQTVTTVVILTFLLVGGYYVRSIPVWISWIRYLSFLFWGYNLLIKTQFSDVTYYSCDSSGTCRPVPTDELALSTDPLAPAYPDVLILLAMLIFLRFIIYWVLRRKTRVQQKKMQ